MQTSFLDMSQYAPSRLTTTHAESCAEWSAPDGSQSSPCYRPTSRTGLSSAEPQLFPDSIPPTGKAEWISCMQDSLARILALQAKAPASTASDPACTVKSYGARRSSGRRGSSSKTFRQSDHEAGTSSSLTWWRSDIPGATESLRRLMLAPLIAGPGGGALHDVPTPTVHGNYNRKGLFPTSGDGLATWVKAWPTPCARDWRSGRQSSSMSRGHAPCLPEAAGGMLNPPWVEWLMGFPIGSTDCEDLETLKFLCAPLPLGACLEAHK